jgi:hypothetical protein
LSRSRPSGRPAPSQTGRSHDDTTHDDAQVILARQGLLGVHCTDDCGSRARACLQRRRCRGQLGDPTGAAVRRAGQGLRHCALSPPTTGRHPKRSYFNGCSTGGREGLLLAQRYPDDFDGVIAGDPANFMGPLMGLYFTWLAKTSNDANGAPIITGAKLPALHQVVISACDGLDGLVDGQIDDPRAYRFDPVAIQCPPGTDQPNCLTPTQVASARGCMPDRPTRTGGGCTPAVSHLAPSWPGRARSFPSHSSAQPSPRFPTTTYATWAIRSARRTPRWPSSSSPWPGSTA